MALDAIIFPGLSVLQCALLHPRFQHSGAARQVRLFILPLTLSWWLYFPFRPPSPPLKDRATTGFYGALMAFKSIEWAFATGPYYLRSLKTVDGVPVWEHHPAPKSGSEDFDFGEFIVWIGLLLTSQRGMRWSWGPTGKGNTASLVDSLLEIVRLQLMMLPAITFLLSSQDHPNRRVDPTTALLKLGFWEFPGLGLVAECLHSTCVMLMILGSLEMFNHVKVACTHVLYPLAKTAGIPAKFTQVLDPAGYPPAFGCLFDIQSLSQFWGKTWHQKLRRPFLFCGGKPAMALAQSMGGSENLQKICGVFGAFTISGILHEYLLYAQHQPPHRYPRLFFHTVPRSFLFFFLQSFGMILEGKIIPMIPSRIGGGRLWTTSFLLLLGPLLAHDLCRPGGMLDSFGPLSRWTWRNLFVPVPLAYMAFPSQ